MGILLIRKDAVVTASSQKVGGKEACLRRAKEVSIRCRCFLSAVPFCSGV